MIGSILRSIIPAHFRPIRYLENLVRGQTGGRVGQGPFAGMHYINHAVGSAFIPKLLGIYERELSACIEKACAMHFPLIVDIGAAEGYYAVGLARRNPNARIVAFEMEKKGRAALREMAGLNGIAVEEIRNDPLLRAASCFRAQLEVQGKCEFENLQAVLKSAERALVVCDVEGYEDALLVPEKIPALGRANLLVEMHDFCCPGITERITQRFAATHDIERIWQKPRSRDEFPFRTFYTRLLPKIYIDWAVSEWRPERMSWLWMRSRNGSERSLE